MSETLVSGFTTGAAVLVLTSQMKHVFGIKLPRHIGPLKVIHVSIILQLFVLFCESLNLHIIIWCNVELAVV